MNEIEFTTTGLPLGFKVSNWSAVNRPSRSVIQGRLCRLEPLSPIKHSEDLFRAFSQDKAGNIWTYLPYGPFESATQYADWITNKCLGDDPLFFAIVDEKSKKAIGVASYLRIDPTNGSIEVGHLCYSPLLSRTAIATEAMYLMMKNAFELGYRRYEWKCNALNAASRSSAQRLGFSYEGIFRQAAVIKGYNRDTAWYAAIDSEWPSLRDAFETWLSPSNFDINNQQKRRLSSLTAPILVARG